MCCQESGTSTYEKLKELRELRNNYVLLAYGLIKEVPQPPRENPPTPKYQDPDSDYNPAQSLFASSNSSTESESDDNTNNRRVSKRNNSRGASKSTEDNKTTAESGSDDNTNNRRASKSTEDNKTTGQSTNKKSIDDCSHKSWLRCRRPALPEEIEDRLFEVIDDINNDDVVPDNKTYIFACRVAKTYHHIWLVDGDHLHCERETLMTKAIMEVFEQVPLDVECPYERQVELAFSQLLPMMETIFDMPGRGMSIGSDGWIDSMIKQPHNIPYLWAAKYPRMEKALVKYLMTQGDKKTGYPELRPGAYLCFGNDRTCDYLHEYWCLFECEYLRAVARVLVFIALSVFVLFDAKESVCLVS